MALKLALTPFLPFLLFLTSCHSVQLDAVHDAVSEPVTPADSFTQQAPLSKVQSPLDLAQAKPELAVTVAPVSATPSPSRTLPNRLQVELIAHLPVEINESSGLAKRHDILWTHNDSGNSATVFAMLASGGAITQRVNLQNAVNKDWEDLAQDDHTLYVADCGNNMGDRQWLQIYKVAWQDLDYAANDGVVSSQLMKIRLADTEPKRNLHAHNNDCEALTVVGEELWLFTKNWQDQNTRLYRIPKEAAEYEAKSNALFAANGLITGADYDPQTQRLALIGYRLGFLNVTAFIWIVPVADNAPLWDQASYHTISPAGQWEAILWHQGNLLVTREQSPLSTPWLGIIYL